MRTKQHMETAKWLAFTFAALLVSSSIINIWMLNCNYVPWIMGDIMEGPKAHTMRVRPFETRPCVSIVYRVGTIRSECDLKRLLAIAKSVPPENYTIILLHDPDRPLESRILRFLQENFGHIEVSQISQDMLYLRKTLDSVLHWASNRSSCHYWVLEDDVVFTGEWGHFFRTVDQRVGNEVDYVSHTHTFRDFNDWYYSRDCNVKGHNCMIDNTTAIVQGANNICRISQRLVDHVVDLKFHQGQLQGHAEAFLPAACRMYPGCKHEQLFPESQFYGYNQMGGWSVWVPENQNKSVFTLAGLDMLRTTKNIGFDIDRIWNALHREDLASQRPPRNRIFHPVKCSADPMIGDVSLGYAAAASFPGYSDILDLLTP